MLDSLWKSQTEIAGLFAIIVLGAIGTALWEVVLKPSSSWLLGKFLSAATLGLDRTKNKIYKKIASGQEESFSQFIAFYLVLILSIAIIIFIINFKFNIINGYKANYDKLISLDKRNEESLNPKKDINISEKMEELKHESLQIRGQINELKNEIIIILKYINLYYITMIIFSCYLIITLWAEHLILAYINSAIRYFNQLVRICAPLMDKAEHLNILSEFARIKSPQEYKNLTERLKKIAEEHEFNVPGFRIWG